MFKGKNFIGTTREKFFFHNTLLCLVKALENKKITIDLRGEGHVCGELDIVDGYMNISFGNAVFCDARGNEYLYDNLFIQARNIKYIHIPENVDAIEIMKDELFNTKTRMPVQKVEKSRKIKKAYKQHMATVAALRASETPSTSFI